jgi:hypothetical protein
MGSTSYVYDTNGNMTNRDSQTVTWDVENRPVSVTGGASFLNNSLLSGQQADSFAQRHRFKLYPAGLFNQHLRYNRP